MTNQPGLFQEEFKDEYASASAFTGFSVPQTVQIPLEFFVVLRVETDLSIIKVVLVLLASKRPMARMDVATHTGLHLNTAVRALEIAMDKGYVRPAGQPVKGGSYL